MADDKLRWQIGWDAEATDSRNLSAGYVLKRMQATPIAKVAHGASAKIVGRARAVGLPLTAPLSGRPCVGYDLRVSGTPGLTPSESDSHRTLQALYGEQTLDNFIVRDDSGEALVAARSPATARAAELIDGRCALHLVRDRQERKIPFRRMSPALSRFLQGQKPSPLYRVTEAVLEQGEWVAVYGQCWWEADPQEEVDLRSAPTRRLRIETGGMQIIVSDDPRYL